MASTDGRESVTLDSILAQALAREPRLSDIAAE